MQGDGKVPHWEPRSQVGVYLGHSLHHAQSVALVLNLTTGHVSSQYHVVFDDDFTTVSHLKLGMVPTNWPELFKNNREILTDETFQLQSDWNQPFSQQPLVHWISATLDSQPTTLANILDSASSTPSHKGDTQNEGAYIDQSEGAHVEQNKGVSQSLASNEAGIIN